MAILSVNAGSSSLKFSLHAVSGVQAQTALLTGSIQGLEPGGQPLLGWRRVDGSDDTPARRELPPAAAGEDPFPKALGALRELLRHELDGRDLQAVAHRVVHGGEQYRAPVLVSDALLADLEALNPLAPLHQPHNIVGIRMLRAEFAGVPQVACFDTAFHAALPWHETALALPRELSAQGIRRYGFHGLAYEHVMRTLREATPRAGGRVLMAHLGNGASLCGALDGRGVATTMGFSALDGLMMGTRSGALDPGVLLHLLSRGWTHDTLQDLLYRRSGLLGVSGLSADMRRLREHGGEDANRAIELFTHRVVRESGAIAACLQGVDVIAFSGGIGEHDATLRHQVCERLGWLGVRLDPRANLAATGDAPARIDAVGTSAVDVWVVPADEGRVAASLAARLLTGG